MLKLEHISKSFDEKTIFRDFSYTFNDTGIYIVKGQSGIGKTTLLRIIAGLDKNFDGTVSGGGIANTSFCFQEHRLFPNLNSLENISKISFRKSNADTENLSHGILSRLGFSKDDMSLYPAELSGGMKQRVAFARSVLRKAPILILDEPTKELDGALASEVLKIIKEEASKRLVILVTHRDEEAEALEGKIINI